MPTPWKKSPQELHQIYLSNTQALYKAAGKSYASQIDQFIRACAMGLWSRAGSILQVHADATNAIYSKDETPPSLLLWDLTSQVCESREFLPPLFFWELVETDVAQNTECSRLFIRLMVNILLTLAAVDDDITFEEASYISECTAKLSAICDSANVKKGKLPLSALDYVTSGEPAFTEKRIALQQNDKVVKNKDQAAQVAPLPPEDLDTLMGKLDALVGLEDVKKDVKSLINLVKVRKLREENGLSLPPMSLHLVFTGNPGTGKTTVARLLSQLYAAIGVLSKGQLVEVDRGGLVAGYVGQTAIKTTEVIQQAIGGILFIDEAYALSSGGENDFGREAIETILKAMEDHRDDLIIIVAGYSLPMKKFLSSNPGLESRFNKYIHFPDYTGEELLQIFQGLCQKHHYTLNEDAAQEVQTFFSALYEMRDDNFGNGRDVRNYFEHMISQQANRVAMLEHPSKEDLMTVLPEDIQGVFGSSPEEKE